MNGTLAPGQQHVAHSVLNALPHAPVALLVVIGALLVAAVVAAVAVASARTVPYACKQDGAGADVAGEAR